VHYACFTGQNKVASSGSRGRHSVAVLLTSFAVLVCFGVNQGHSSLMGAQWLGCLYRSSTMGKMSVGQGTGEQVMTRGHLSKKKMKKNLRNTWRENGGGVGA